MLELAARAHGPEALDRWIAERDDAALHTVFVDCLPYLFPLDVAMRLLARYAEDDRHGLAAPARTAIEEHAR